MKKNFNSLMIVWAFIAFTLLTFSGCDMPAQTSDQKTHEQQEQLTLQSTNAVGMPAITKFAEKRMMKTIIELRDKEVATYTYIVSMNNEYKLLCHSVGYGLPFATQYTNPQRVLAYRETSERGNIALPQADPNGLFSPANAEGTWVMCLDPTTKLAVPLYSEPRVIVSPFALQ